MQTSMRGRPRPVTATVTKPRWMQLPDPDAMARIRRNSLGSNGSTESLTSLLDHDSYNSVSRGDLDQSEPDEFVDKLESADNDRTKIIRHSKQNNQQKAISPGQKKVSGKNLSAWEQWVIVKEKEDRLKREQEKEKRTEEKLKKEKENQEKQVKLQKAEVVRKSWTEKKNQEEVMNRKMEKLKVKESKLQKEKMEQEIKQKAVEKFSLWLDLKKKEDKAKRRQSKEQTKKIQEHESQRKQRAEACFQHWLEHAKNRPKSAPNSFGFMAGRLVGYHDRSAYPQPTFVNPLPWQPIAAPSSSKQERPKPKMKPYNWNPDKYL